MMKEIEVVEEGIFTATVKIETSEGDTRLVRVLTERAAIRLLGEDDERE